MPLRSGSLRAPAIAAAALFSAAFALRAAPQEPSRADEFAEQDLDFFETKVRPLFAEHCFRCHSQRAEKLKGKLRLDSREAVLAGGATGPALVPRDPDASLLVRAVRYGGEVQMPPAGKLDDASIATLVEWVRRGAPMPAESSSNSGATLAAREIPPLFRALGDPHPPPVQGEAWCRNEIDRFVLAQLEAEGLAPAPRADRRTLLRRLTFDLIGLPPTEEELSSFERDNAPDAWEKQIDRLLASPHYGERWGRAWLDLARYSDSNGLDENLAMSNAWRYRDWVVRALNEDLPYDRFVTWQLAGDLLPEPADERELRDRLTATGFLVLGPKMLAEQDKEKLVFDVVDEQMDVAFRTFDALTLGCARCHDHKFDPISQRDYYALAGVFKSTATMRNLEFVSRWNERELAPRAAVEARHAAVAAADATKKALDELRERASDRLRRQWTAEFASYLLAGTEAARNALFLEAEEASRGNLVADKDQFGTSATTIARTGGPGEQFAEYDLTFAEAAREQLEVRMASKEARPMRVLLDGRVVAEAALGDTTGSWTPDGMRWVRACVLEVHAGRNVLRLERAADVPHLDQLVLARVPDGASAVDWPIEGSAWARELAPDLVRSFASFVVRSQRSEDGPLALWNRFAKLDSAEFEARAGELTTLLREQRASGALGGNALVLALLDGLPPTSLRELAGRYQTLASSVDHAWRERKKQDAGATKLDDPAQDELRELLHGPASPFALPAGEIEARFGEQQRSEIAAAKADFETKQALVPPELDSALAVRDVEKPEDCALLRRGNHLDKSADAIPRGGLAALESVVPFPQIAANESGRLQLANWLVDPEHPLTTRVIVNRLWQGHFGHGLVRSSSNFGARGDAPSHPELLDWLARELVRRRWSLKEIHRAICASATYCTSCESSDDAAMRDPENRLLSHQNRRRLDAEGIRDSLLSVSGQLDLTLGGSFVDAKNGDYITNDQSKLAARFDAPRRTLYLPIVRNAMLDLFSAFDYPDPSVTVEQRPSTTSAPQALYLMNSPVVVAASRKVAESSASVRDPVARVDALYTRVLARHASAEEAARGARFVERLAKTPAAQPPSSDVGASAATLSPEGESPKRESPEREAWRALAQVLLASNEFLFVD